MVNTQFKDIGEIAKVLKNVGTDSNSLASNLGDIGIEAAKAALEINNVSENVQRATLVQKYGKEATDAIMNVGDAAASLTSKVKNLGNAFVGAGKSAKDLFIGTITAHPIITTVTAVVATLALMSAVAVDAQEKVENAVTSAEKYQQTKTEIQSINSELETIGSQIDQLNAKENLSLTDAQELSRLQAQSAELERQLEIKKSLAEIEQQQAARDAKNAFSAKSSRNAIDTNGEGFWTNIADGIESFAAWFNDKTGATEAGLAQTGGLVGFIRGESNAGTPDQILLDRIKAAKTAQKKLKELQDKQTAENYDSIQSQIDNQQKVVDNYATNLQELYSEMESYTKSFYDDSTGEILSGFEEEAKRWEAVQKEYLDYFGNTASSKESAINTLFAKKQFSGLEESFTKAAQTGESAIKSLINETPGISDALDKAGVSVDEFVQHFMALGNPNALNLENVKNQITKAYSDILGENPTAADLKKSDYRNLEMQKFLKDKSDEEITLFYKYVNDGDIDLSDLTLEDIQELFIKVTADTTEVESAYDRVIAKSSTWLATIDNINAALVNSVSGSGLTATIDEATGTLTGNVTDIINAYKDLDGFDASTLFEETANGIHLNTDALRLLQAQEEANNKTEFLKARKELLQQLAEEQAKLNTITDQSSIEYSNQQSVIDGLQNQIQTVELLSSAYDGATSAYQKWLNAQSSGEEGDMYRNVSETMRERAKTLYDEGRVNTNEFRAIAQFYSNKDLSTASAEQVVKAYEKASDTIKKYFTGDKTGIDAFVADMKKLSDKENLGWVEELKDGSLKFNTGSDEEIADRLGISKEAIQSLYRAMTEYIDGIQIGDTSGEDTLSDQIEKAKEKAKAAQKELQDTMDSMSGENKIDLSFDIDAIDDVDELQSKINELTEYKKTLDVDSDEYQQAQDIIDGCKARIQEINNENAVISVTIDGEDGIATLKEAIDSIPEDKSSNININVQDSSQIENTVAEIEKIPENKTANFTFNVQNQEDADALSAKIDDLNSKRGDNKITYTVSVVDNTGNSTNSKEAKVNYSLGKQEDPKDKQAKVNYILGKQAIPNDKFAKVNYSLGTQARPKDVTVKVNYDTSAKPSGVGGADGTAHVNGTAPKIKSSSFNDGLLGTAHVSGDWSLKQDETALTGELGREIVVRNGRFFTIGDNGAEFTKLKKGDIIFNHRQTEDLLSKGYVTGRGKLIGGNAHVEGTAYSNAKGWTIGKTLGDSGSNTSSSKTSSKSTNEKKSTDKNTKAVDRNTSATNKNTKAIEESQDWISVRLDRISKQLDEYKTLASDYYQAFANQNKMLDTAINQVKANIQTNEQAYMAYMQKANSIGLDAGYKQRVMNGEINIETITDENLKNLISEFQDFYEKAQDCREAIIDLKNQIVELSTQKIDNILDDYDAFFAMSDSIYGRFEAENKLFDAMGKSASEYNLQMMLNQRNNQVMYSRGELEDLVNLNNSLLQSGDIKMWSQEWYDLQGKIHDVYTQIYEAETEVYELRQQLREVRWEPFRKAIEDIDAVNDNLENTLSLISDLEAFGKDSDALNMNGKLQLGLLTKQLGNARQAVAEYENAFKALDNELANGNITQEQYDEQLKELNEGRWEAVSSVKKYRDAILDLVKDGINKETEAMQKLVDARKKDLQAQKDAADYARTLRDKTTEINKIKAQIASLQGDDSATAKAQLRNLQNQLKEKEQDLQDTQDDHAFDVLQDGYDNAMEKFEEIQENELYLLNSSLEAQNEAIANMLMVARDNYQEIYNELNEIAEVYGMKLSDDIVNPWTTATEAVNAYKQAVGNLSSQTTIDTSPINGVSGNTDYVRYEENNNSAPDNNVTQQQQSTTVSGKISDVPEVLQYGSQGNSVKLLQTALNALGFNCGDVDGSFGDQTLAAVKRFQKSVGMAGDGIVGDNTKAHFRARGYKKGSPNTQKGLAYYDEEGLGSEVIITDKGVLRQFNAGEIVFNAEQAKYLYDTSKFAVKHNFPTAQMPLYNPELLQRDYGVHFDCLVNVEGNVTEDVMPMLERMVDTKIKMFDKETRRKISNNYRKVGGQFYQW